MPEVTSNANIADPELEVAELEMMVEEAKKIRGGKPAKYPRLDKYQVNIIKLLDENVQLPYILKWLTEKKGEDLGILTLRKFVIKKIGRDGYENYLKRNGWMKNKRKVVPSSAEKVQALEKDLPPPFTSAVASTNPLSELGKERKSGEFNPIPTTKFEVDNF